MKAFLFDMDGVLTDTEKSFYQMMDGMIEYYHLRPRTDELVKLIAGQTHDVQFARMNGYFGIDKPAEYYAAGFEHAVQENPHIWDQEPMVGIVDFLKAVKVAGFKTGVCTSAYTKEANERLERIGLKDSFDVVVTGEKVQRSKPAPDIYLRGAEELGVEAKDCVVLEDSANGIASGINAGMYVIGVKISEIRQDTSAANEEIDAFTKIDLEKFKA